MLVYPQRLLMYIQVKGRVYLEGDVLQSQISYFFNLRLCWYVLKDIVLRIYTQCHISI